MKVLIIGSGGREHAMTWKAAQSKYVSNIFIAPGNAGTALEPKSKNIAISATDCQALLNFALAEKIDLTLVGPEAPLALGIVDLFQHHNLAIFGPTQAAAQLESSKAFCKTFLTQHHIPTAKYAEFNALPAALNYLEQQSYPLVIKADGLAAGKGVIIAQTKQQAHAAAKDMLSGNQFGEAGAKIIIEEFLQGEELSYIVVSDGKTILPLASSQDHKRRDDNDKGPNTGGMGAYSPAPLLTDALEKTILEKIIQPTINGMQQRGTPYKGFLYAGIMVVNNEPFVLEYNCRLGDPETQPLMMRLQSDLIELCQKTVLQQLHDHQLQWDSRFALAVVMASEGYPNHYSKGDVISGLDNLIPNSKIFHAGTLHINNHVVTAGGRVVAATALGATITQAQQQAYQLAQQIHWRGCFYRHDIGAKAHKQ